MSLTGQNWQRQSLLQPAKHLVDPFPVLLALLDSWDYNNTILLNLLRIIPEGGLDARALQGSPSVVQLFTHIHYVRLVFVLEDAPEFARDMPKEEWVEEHDRDRIANVLDG